MSALRSVNQVQPRTSPQSAFLAADYDTVIALLNNHRSAEDASLLARTHIRLGRYDEAVHVLNGSKIRATPTGLAIRADVEISRGRYDDAQSFLDATNALRKTADEADRVRFERALLAFCREDTATAEALLKKSTPVMGQRYHELRGAVLMRKRKYREAIDMFEQAARGIDQHVKYSALANASFIAREMYLPEIMRRIEALAQGDPPKYLAHFHMHILRGSAWFLALNGKLKETLSRCREAARFAISDPWKISILTDRGYLSLAFGHQEHGWDDIEEAMSIARQIDWTKSKGEERRVLLTLASLLADRNMIDANWCWQQYSSLKPTEGHAEWSRDIRSKAFELVALGALARSAGKMHEAHAYFSEAFKIFRDIGYHWRAVLTMLARSSSCFTEMNGPEYVQIVLKEYPNSWLRALVERQMHIQLPPAGVERLTPRERQVFDLLIQCKTNKEIAETLRRKEATIADHVRHLLKKLDCSSRKDVIRRYAVVQAN